MKAQVSDISTAYEELRQAIDGGSESMTHEDAVKAVKYWQDEIDELRAALNGSELFEQSFLHQKGKIERLESQLQERDVEMRGMGEDLIAIQNVHNEQKARLYAKEHEMSMLLGDASVKIAAQRKVLEQALEALQSLFSFEVDEHRGERCASAITAIQGALHEHNRTSAGSV